MSAMSERAAEIDALIRKLSASEVLGLAVRLAGEVGFTLSARPARPDFSHLRGSQDGLGRPLPELRKTWATSPVQFGLEAHRLLRTCEWAIAMLMARHVNAGHDDFRNADALVETITVFCDVGDIAGWFKAASRPGALSADEAMAWLAARPNYELSHGYDDPEDEGSWRVFRVNGGVNDREWTLVATGSTPLYAIQAAVEKTGA